MITNMLSIKLKNILKESRQYVHYFRSCLFIPDYMTHVKTSSNENVTKCKSHSILETNGFISNCTVSGHGLITNLPLGVRVHNKLIKLIRNEMNAVGGQQVDMPSLCDLSVWTQTGRDQSMGSELFRLRDRKENMLCLCPTHEEVVTTLVSRHAKTVGFGRLSNPPALKLYQITKKFRDESKPRHGLFRAREFTMKDLYTFHLNEKCMETTYQEICHAYKRIFERLELDVKRTTASVGQMGGSKSEEFHILSEVGEDKIVICERCGKSASLELMKDDNLTQINLCEVVKCRENNIDSNKKLSEKRAIECGHTFILGDRYTKKIPIPVQSGQPILMACYGIGVSRLMQACVEHHATDSKFPEWPLEISPFEIAILPAKFGSKEAERSEKLVPYICKMLDQENLFQNDIYIDDRTSQTIGSRLIDARLIGIPFCLILGKSLQENEETIEIVINNSRLSKLLNKTKIHCHSRELAVVLKQLKNDYFYKRREIEISSYIGKSAN